MRYLRPLNFYIITLLSLFVMNLSVIADTSKSKENVKSIQAPKQKILPGLPCQPDVDQCLKGTCRKITRFTDVNLCQTEGNSCKVDKECCSLRCDKSSGKCLANYRCATCKSIGTKIIKGKTKCCPGLYPNRENICIPLYPILLNSIFKKIKSFAVSSLNLLIKETYANDALDAKKEIARTKLTQLMASASSLFNNGDNSTDSGEVSGPEALRLYFKNKIDNANSILVVTNIISQMNDVKSAAQKVSQALSSINQAYNNMNIDPVLKRQAIADASERVNYCISGNSYDQNPYGLPDDGSENDQDGFTLPSLSALQSCLNNIVSNISEPSLEEMGMIAYLTDGTIPSDVFMQGWVQPDDSLYAPMFRSDENQNNQSTTPSVNVPFIKRPQVLETESEDANENNIEANYTFEKFKGSDFKSCRVNLFADYMMSQGDAYYEALFTFLSLDYVTSGGGVDDKIVVGEWKRHIQSLDEDYDGINVTANANANSNSLYGVPRDKFDEYNEAVEQNINDYFQNTLSNDVERKIFTYLFLNGFISSSVKEKILNYYIYQDTARTNTLINALGPVSFPSPESFSLFKITRFEAVKYKMYLYKLIGKFRRKSIKLTCRCVDINGPVNGDKWLEDDVKETYIKYCNNVGKYKLYKPVSSNQQVKAIIENQKSTNENLSEGLSKVEQSKGLQGTVSDQEGKAVVDQTKNQLNSNISDTGDFKSDGQFSSLNNFQETNELVSRYSDWLVVKNGVTNISFEKFNKENPDKVEGLGHGIHYQEMLWQMALSKSEILMEVASENLFSVSEGLSKIKMFLMTFNWGYTKTSINKEVRTRKVGCISLILSMLKQLFGHREMAFGHSSEWDINVTKFNYQGSIMNNSDLDVGNVMSTFDLRPKRVCNKRHFKRKTSICKRKYYYHCVRNDLERNDICNKKLPVGMCIKSVHAYKDWANNKKFILDPFVPEGTSIPTPSESNTFYNTLNVSDFQNSWVNQVKRGASQYMYSEFFSLAGLSSEEISSFAPELQAFEEFTFRYIFYYPKMASKARYMTEGLIPFFDRLISISMMMNMGIMMDLNNAATLALQLEESYVNVIENENIIDVTEYSFNGFEDIPFTFSTFGGDVLPEYVTSIPEFNSLESFTQRNGNQDFGDPVNSDNSNNRYQDFVFNLNNSNRNNSITNGRHITPRGTLSKSDTNSDYHKSKYHLIKKYDREMRRFADTARDRLDQRNHQKEYMKNNKRSKELLELERRAKENNKLFKRSLASVSSATKARFNKSFGGRESNSLASNNPEGLLKGGEGLKEATNGKRVSDPLSKSLKDDLLNKSSSSKAYLGAYLKGLSPGQETIYDATKESGVVDKELNDILNGDDKSATKSVVKPKSGPGSEDDFIDLSDIEDEKDLEGFSFGPNGEVISKASLIKYFKDKGLSDKDARKKAQEAIKENKMSLFQIVSRRYIRSAYPRFLFLRKKKDLN